MRRITVNYDGAEYVIAPLTLAQCEELEIGEAKRPPEEATTKERTAFFDAYTFKIIMASLNRAAGEEEWTAEKCRKELDRKSMLMLVDDILRVSGLKMDSKPGEMAATSGN